METIINNPSEKGESNAGSDGIIIGAAVVVLTLVVLFIYSMPYLRERFNIMTRPSVPVISPTINVLVPYPSTSPVQTTTK